MIEEDYKILKLLCTFSNEICYVGLYRAVLYKNGHVIYVLIYSESHKPTVITKYELLGIAFEDFKKKVEL